MHKVETTGGRRKRKASITGRTPMESLKVLQERERGAAEALHSERRASMMPPQDTVSNQEVGETTIEEQLLAGTASSMMLAVAQQTSLSSGDVVLAQPTGLKEPPVPLQLTQSAPILPQIRGSIGPRPPPGHPARAPRHQDVEGEIDPVSGGLPPLPGGTATTIPPTDGALVPLSNNPNTVQQVAKVFNETAGKEPASYSSFASLEGAKIRRQLFSLCQQLFRGSKVHMEILVKEQGNIVWQSSNWDEDESLVQVDVLDDDIQEVQRRSRSAFNKTVQTYNKKLRQQQSEIERLKEDIRSREQGGSRYSALQKELELARFDSRKQQAKIKSLVKLLDRAAAQLKAQEEQRENEQQARLAGEVGLDWLGVQAVIKDLVIDDREDHAILRDVASFVEQTTTRLNEVEVSNEILAEKCGEKDVIAENFKKERDQTALNNMKLSQENQKLNSSAEDLRSEVEDLKQQIAQLKSDSETERNRLHAQINQQELAMKNAVESKAYFIGQGKSAAVQPFLRFEGKVRNIELPKKDIEQMIVHIWASREEVTTKLKNTPSLSAIDRRAERSLLHHLNSAHQKAVDLAALEEQQQQQQLSNSEGGEGEDGGFDGTGMFVGSLQPASVSGGTSSGQSTCQHQLDTNTLYLGAFTCCGQFLTDYENDFLWLSRGAASIRGGGTAGDFGASLRGVASGGSVVSLGSSVAAGSGASIGGLSLPDHLVRFFIEQNCSDRCGVLMPSYNAWMNGVMPANRQPFAEFLLKRATSLPSVAAEQAYSLLDGCERYKYDADVELFRRIIKKEISESAFFDQMIMIQKLKFSLFARAFALEQQRKAEEVGNNDFASTAPLPDLPPSSLAADSGSDLAIGVDEVMTICHQFFPAKPPESFPLLRKALETDVRTPMASKGRFNIPKLFASNEFGNQGAFVEAVRDQHLDEVCMHVAEVADAISAVGARPASSASTTSASMTPEPSVGVVKPPASPQGPAMKEGEATLASVRTALLDLDPLKPMQDINKFLIQLLDLSQVEQFAVTPQLGAGRSMRGEKSKNNADLAASFSPSASISDGMAGGGSPMINLNTVVDCVDLSRLSKSIFSKRYGRPKPHPSNRHGSVTPPSATTPRSTTALTPQL